MVTTERIAELESELRTLRMEAMCDPDETLPELTEAQCFIIDAAMQHGFEIADDNAVLYQCTDRQIVAFIEAVIADTRAKMQVGA